MGDPATSVIRVLIADDHAVVREGIRQVLASEPGFDVVAEAVDGVAAVRLAKDHVPDVIVLDLSLPLQSGLDAAAQIRSAMPNVRILVLSIHDHEEYVLRSVRVGAHGYLRKDSSPAELRAAIRAVHAGASVFSPAVASSLATALQHETERDERDARVASLTSRERDVLREIARGRTNKQIAAALGISVRTVESHREAVSAKLRVRGAAGLVRVAIECGLDVAVPTRRTAEPEDRVPPNGESA